MAPSRKALYEDDRTWLWKFILRMLTIVLAAVGIACVAWAFVTSFGRFEDRYYYGFYGTALVPWGLISLGLSILWNIANMAVLLSRNRPIIPGANVGCDLVLWLLLLGTGVLLVLSAQDNIKPYYVYDCDYDYGYYGYTDRCLQYDFPSNHRQGIVEAVGSGFTFAVMLCHFALFVSACRYTHERRRARMTTQTSATIARDMMIELTRIAKSAPAPPPLSGTDYQHLTPQHPLPAPAFQVSTAQQQQPFAASAPRIQVPQQQQQSAYPLTNLQQPPRALSPVHVQQPSSSWILPESMPNSVIYHLTTPGHDIENRHASAEPVSPIISPQTPGDRGHSVIHTLDSDENHSRELRVGVGA